MRFLADSHTLIWWWDQDERLSKAALSVMMERSNTVFISAASGWELATKVRSGRLPSMVDRIANYDANVIADGFQHLAVQHQHGVKGGLLDGDHRDPFDRLIAAQALIEDLTVITRDREIAAFGCKVLW